MVAYLVFGFNNVNYREEVLGVFDNVMKADKFIKTFDNIEQGVDRDGSGEEVEPPPYWAVRRRFDALDFYYSYFQIVKYNGDRNLGVLAKYDRVKREISL
jgi:hypothetical protein